MEAAGDHCFLISSAEVENKNPLKQKQSRIIKSLRKKITAEKYREFLALQALEKQNPLKALEVQARQLRTILKETNNEFIRGQAGFFLRDAEEAIASFAQRQEEAVTTVMLEEAEAFLLKKQALVLGPGWFKKIWWFLKSKLGIVLKRFRFDRGNKVIEVDLSKEELNSALAVVERDRNKPALRGELARSEFHHVETAGFLRRKFCCGGKVLKVKVFYKRGSGAINRGADHHICIRCFSHEANIDH